MKLAATEWIVIGWLVICVLGVLYFWIGHIVRWKPWKKDEENKNGE